MLRLIAIALLWPALVQAAPATTTTKTATTRPDSHVWTKRNVELIRQATTRRGGEAFDGDGIGTTLMFSLGFNPLIVHDPYAGEILKHIDAALAKPGGDADARATMQNAAKFLRLPQDERILRQIVREMEDDPDDDQSLDKPVVRPDNLHKLATKLSSALSSAPSGEPYDGLITRTIEKMDAVARQAKRWDHLVLAYVAFAHAALERDQREQANRYIDRMIEIFREHPSFQDPNRGNTDAVDPTGVAGILLRAGRQRDLDALVNAVDKPTQIELLIGMVAALAQQKRLDDARQVAEARLRPLAPAEADRIAAALDGKLAPATRPTTATTRPAELRLFRALSSIAAAQDNTPPKEDKDLASHQWATVGLFAHRRGDEQSARRAFDRSLELLRAEPTSAPAEIEEKTRFVREALAAKDVELAHRMLNTSSAPGAYGYDRLARAHRRLGNTARGNALADEALVRARKERGSGHVMANIAVDRHAAGDVKGAQALLREAMDHLDGEGFGLGVTAAVVSAASKMNRLDVLDHIYETADPADRMLLCIVASRAGLGHAIEDDD